jgi:hypothetical protein
MTDTNDDNMITPDEMAPPPEGEEAPVDDYPENETVIRSPEDTKAAENRAPAEPSPGATAPLDMEDMTAATAPPMGAEEAAEVQTDKNQGDTAEVKK